MMTLWLCGSSMLVHMVMMDGFAPKSCAIINMLLFQAFQDLRS